VVRCVPYLAHLPIVLITDLYMWRVSRRTV